MNIRQRLDDDSVDAEARDAVIDTYAKAAGTLAIHAALAELEQRTDDAAGITSWVERAMRNEAKA